MGSKMFKDLGQAMQELRKGLKPKRARVADRPAKPPSAEAKAIAMAARIARLVRMR